VGAIDLADKTGARQVLAAINNTHAGVADSRRMITIVLNLVSEATRQILRR
jgi:hypothetical protein